MKFKIGDKVKDTESNNIGTIIKIDYNLNFPICVDFNDSFKLDYTKDGYFWDNDNVKTKKNARRIIKTK